MSELFFKNIKHPFEPVYCSDSEILIVGSFPSVKSRAEHFYYGHPRNRFWQVLALLFNEKEPQCIDEKKALLYRKHIALWDVIEQCDIRASDDSSITNVRPTDLQRIIRESRISRIYANGRKAATLYNRYQKKHLGFDITPLPSTSPANAAWNLARLIACWQKIILP